MSERLAIHWVLAAVFCVWCPLAVLWVWSCWRLIQGLTQNPG